MDEVLQRFLETDQTRLPDGRVLKVDGKIGPEAGALLQRAIRAVRPRQACEVGLAFGVSTLWSLDALAECDGMLIGMDPAQHDDHWNGAGLENVRSAGHASR